MGILFTPKMAKPQATITFYVFFLVVIILERIFFSSKYSDNTHAIVLFAD